MGSVVTDTLPDLPVAAHRCGWYLDAGESGHHQPAPCVPHLNLHLPRGLPVRGGVFVLGGGAGVAVHGIAVTAARYHCPVNGDPAPRPGGRGSAIRRTDCEGPTVVLGSATPAI